MSQKKYCPHCGSVAKPKMKGSSFITILLLICGIIPGLIYDTWRAKAGRTICPSCRHEGMIPLNSPMAIKAMRETTLPPTPLKAAVDDRTDIRL
jgi:hypothetical protein